MGNVTLDNNKFKDDIYDIIEESEKTICDKCNKNQIPKRFLNSHIKFCEQCYKEEKEKLFQKEILIKGQPQIDQITDQLFLGNNHAAKNKELLQSYKITNILVVGFFLHEYFPNDFKYKTIEISDNENENLFDYFMPCFDFIDRSERCFVHCRAGVSRSSTIVISFIMLSEKMSFENARNFVKGKRSIIEPNKGFESQLKDFENVLIMCQYKYKLVKEYFNSFVKKNK
jgi:atypical dual specificity phosphatase